MREQKQPQIFLESSGIQESYVNGLFDYYSDIRDVLNRLVGRFGRIDIRQMLPQTHEHMRSFVTYMHHNVEETMFQLESVGVSEAALHELLYQRQMRWKLDHNELTETTEPPLARSDIAMLSVPIYTSLQDASQNLSEDQKVKNATALVQPADVHDLNNVINSVIMSSSIPESLKAILKNMGRAMSENARLLQGLLNKHPAAYACGTIITRGISAEWADFIRYISRQTHDPLVHSALQEAMSIFNGILSISELEKIELISFLESQMGYLEAAGHRHDPSKRITIDLENEQTADKIFILGNRGKMITLLRNLIEDATLHGNYQDDIVNVDIAIKPIDNNGVTSLRVTNPVWNTEDTVQKLSERLGNERVVFDTDGNAVTLDPHDFATQYKLHGLGKLSVAITSRQTLAQAGFDPTMQDRYVNHQWSYAPANVESNNESRQWFKLSCNVPLPKTA